ncbi:MAG: hypothetical protein Q9227_003790 [Pyrenula ochraceoflavens]
MKTTNLQSRTQTVFIVLLSLSLTTAAPGHGDSAPQLVRPRSNPTTAPPSPIPTNAAVQVIVDAIQEGVREAQMSSVLKGFQSMCDDKGMITGFDWWNVQLGCAALGSPTTATFSPTTPAQDITATFHTTYSTMTFSGDVLSYPAGNPSSTVFPSSTIAEIGKYFCSKIEELTYLPDPSSQTQDTKTDTVPSSPSTTASPPKSSPPPTAHPRTILLAHVNSLSYPFAFAIDLLSPSASSTATPWPLYKRTHIPPSSPTPQIRPLGSALADLETRISVLSATKINDEDNTAKWHEFVRNLYLLRSARFIGAWVKGWKEYSEKLVRFHRRFSNLAPANDQHRHGGEQKESKSEGKKEEERKEEAEVAGIEDYKAWAEDLLAGMDEAWCGFWVLAREPIVRSPPFASLSLGGGGGGDEEKGQSEVMGDFVVSEEEQRRAAGSKERVKEMETMMRGREKERREKGEGWGYSL